MIHTFLQRLIFAVSISIFLIAAQLQAESKTQIKPEINYRMAFLNKNSQSVYAKEEHKNFVDQLYLALHFSSELDFQHRVVLEPAIRTKRNNPDDVDLDDLHLIDQAYIDSSLNEFLKLTVGKKTEYSGSGLFVNPSDLLNEDKDLFDPLYQKEGKVFSRLSLGLENFSLGIGFIPKRAADSDEGKFWAVIKANFWNTDISIQQTQHHIEKSTIGFSMSRFFGDVVEAHLDMRHQARQRSQQEFIERYDEDQLAYGPEDGSLYYLVGTRLVLTPKRSVVLEYIKNESGLLNNEFETIYLPHIASLNAKPDPPSRVLKRNYTFLHVFDEDLVQSVRMGLSVLYGLQDQSSFVVPQLKYVLSNITSIEYTPFFFSGKSESEFGQMPFKGVHYITIKGIF